jgi:hypothetical protein
VKKHSYRILAVGLVLFAFPLVSCLITGERATGFGQLLAEESGNTSSASGKGKSGTKKSDSVIVLQSFNGSKIPRNKGGDTYPSQYGGVGKGTVSLNKKDSVKGNSLQIHLTSGRFYPQFNPYGPVLRGFAREYVSRRKPWKFNHYNRLRFWIKVPSTATPHLLTGQGNIEFGTYVKRVGSPDNYSDETGGGHFYHILNVPAVGQWTQVVLNMHPSHQRGSPGGMEHGNMPHPTKEDKYNYFDALTRFYMEALGAPSSYPAKYLVDEFEFYRESYPENDNQIYSITGTYVPTKKRLIITWCRNKDENKIKHEVRYAFANIHALGWKKAKAAPDGIITPPGDQGYNGMVYDKAQFPVSGKSLVYVAIKPQNSEDFSQIAIPLTKGKSAKSANKRR